MNSAYDAAWDAVERLDEIRDELEELMEERLDRDTIKRLKAATEHIGQAVKLLEDVQPKGWVGSATWQPVSGEILLMMRDQDE